MDSLIVGLLISILLGQVLLAIALGAVAWLCYKTLVRPEAPCYASGLASKFGMMSIDPSHPAYSMLAKKLVVDKVPGDKAPVVDGGNYL